MSRIAILLASLLAPAAAPTAAPLPTMAFHDRASGVSLRIPRGAEVSRVPGSYTVHNSGGWRVSWSGPDQPPGRLVVRLVLPVVPARYPQDNSWYEALQVGVSADPAAVRTCQTDALADHAQALPDRTIHGVRFAATSQGSGGMSQSVGATAYRAVIAGRCYAVDRVSFGNSATSNPKARVSAEAGAAAMDAALGSVRIVVR